MTRSGSAIYTAYQDKEPLPPFSGSLNPSEAWRWGTSFCCFFLNPTRAPGNSCEGEKQLREGVGMSDSLRKSLRQDRRHGCFQEEMRRCWWKYIITTTASWLRSPQSRPLLTMIDSSNDFFFEHTDPIDLELQEKYLLVTFIVPHTLSNVVCYSKFKDSVMFFGNTVKVSPRVKNKTHCEILFLSRVYVFVLLSAFCLPSLTPKLCVFQMPVSYTHLTLPTILLV